MSRGLALIQDGLRSLGYDPGPTDGLWGVKTAAALSRAIAAKMAPEARPVASGVLARIIWHWTAGTNAVSALDRLHYHFIIAGDGAVTAGNLPPEANLSARDGEYAAHTLEANTESIGVAMAGMHGAREAPFDAGGFPITDVQVTALVGLLATLCRRYSIPVTPQTVLSHAEVQPTLGIAQRGKWDTAWLPGMTRPGNPVAIGNTIRGRVIAAMKEG
jgi:hypothetical protein